MTVEPLLIVNGDGCEIALNDGSAYSIDSVFNCITILLGCSSNNSHIDLFLRDSNWRFRGNYHKAVRQPLNIQTLSDIDNAVYSDLKPLTDSQIVSGLSSLTRNPDGKRIETTMSFIYEGEPVTRTLVFEGDTIISVGE